MIQSTQLLDNADFYLVASQVNILVYSNKLF